MPEVKNDDFMEYVDVEGVVHPILTLMVNVRESFGIDGKIYETALDRVGLTLNANALPNDKGGAYRPSGVRLGTPAITTRGLDAQEMKIIAGWMKQVLDICVKAGDEAKLDDYAEELGAIREEVRALALQFPVPGIKKSEA